MDRQNVIILSGDSLRYDRALDHDVMPYVASRAESGCNFDDAVSNAGFTPGSFPSMMASRYSSSIDGIGLPAEGGVTTLAEELSRVGYDCAVYSDNKFVGPDYNYNRGYDGGSGYEDNLRDVVRRYVPEDGRLFGLLEFGYMEVWGRIKNALVESHYYAPAADLNGRARSWLDGKDSETDGVHLWIHYMDSHHPYEPPSEYMPDDLEAVTSRSEANEVTRRVCKSDGEACTDAEIEDARRLYDAECRYLDDRIRHLVEEYLIPEGWLTDDDLLVLTSDHGEIIEAYDQWGEFGHGNYFCEECTRVPLIMSGPVEPAEIGARASLVDLVPTILDVVDVDPAGADLMLGESLLSGKPDAEPDPVFYDGTRGFYGARGKSLKRFNDETVGEATFRTTEYDADGECPVDPTDGHRRLEEFADDMLDRCEGFADETDAIDPDDLQVKQHMRDLGYLE